MGSKKFLIIYFYECFAQQFSYISGAAPSTHPVIIVVVVVLSPVFPKENEYTIIKCFWKSTILLYNMYTAEYRSRAPTEDQSDRHPISNTRRPKKTKGTAYFVLYIKYTEF